MSATATINALASGAWAPREGCHVTIVAVKPNGRATGVRLPEDGSKVVRYIPSRWLTVEAQETPRRPLRCAHTILEA
jgi:hypothetical protein